MNIYDFVNFGFLNSARDYAGGMISNAISDELTSRQGEEYGGMNGAIGRRARNRDLAKKKMQAGKSRQHMGASIDNVGKLLEDVGMKGKLSSFLRDTGGRLIDSGEGIKDEAVDMYDRNTSRPLRLLHKLEGKEMTYGNKAEKNRMLSMMKKDILNRYRNKQVENKAQEFERELTARDAYRVNQAANRAMRNARKYRRRMRLDDLSTNTLGLFV